MKVLRVVKKNQVKKLARKYGDKLLCVRYRLDEEKQRKYITVELIEDEYDCKPKRKTTKQEQKEMLIQILYEEFELREQAKKAGGHYEKDKKLWRLAWNVIKKLGLQDRIVK